MQSLYNHIKSIIPNINPFNIEKLQYSIFSNNIPNHDDLTINKNNNMFFIKPSINFIETNIPKLFNINLLTKTNKPQKILVDFSSPNICKDMHVGHLRSTIIGDSICRLYELLGHNVLRINHIGDFGTQFGYIIEYLLLNKQNLENLTIYNLQDIYKLSKELFDTDNDFKIKSYNRTLLLQNKDEDTLKLFNIIYKISITSYNNIYDKLNIKLTEQGESYYQPLIKDTLNKLTKYIIQDDGMNIIKLNNNEPPLIMQKSNLSYTYDTTDITALDYRLNTLKCDKIIYVVDVGQSGHFKLLFDLCYKLGWANNNQLEHVGFGLVLGDDNKKFRSRDGDTVKLNDLLDETLIHAENVYKIKNHDNKNKDKVINTIGYGAIKYYDLSITRTSNYKFSYKSMMNLEGNTVVYQLYNYVRCVNIIKNTNNYKPINFKITNDDELKLSILILHFYDVIQELLTDYMFHKLCKYLYLLSSQFSVLYNKYRIIDYQDNKINDTPLILCYITKNIMEVCFNILNINLLESI